MIFKKTKEIKIKYINALGLLECVCLHLTENQLNMALDKANMWLAICPILSFPNMQVYYVLDEYLSSTSL